MDKIINDKENYYLPNRGVNNFNTQVYNEYLHESFKQIFMLLEKCEIEYYVFAGSAIGYLRNKKNIPWADDYDIMIFEEEKEKFEKKFLPLLIKNNFTYGLPHLCRPDLYPKHCGWQITGRHINNQSFFLFDVFLSTIDENGFVRNTGNFGVYHNKNIPIEYIKPRQYLTFDGLNIPFVNNIEKYVELEYGDVINKTFIHLSHGSLGYLTFNEHWTEIYNKFNLLVNEAKEKTHQIIFTNKNYSQNEKLIIKQNMFNDELDILKYINKNNIGVIYFDDIQFLKYCFVIKHYYPSIKINYYLYEILPYSNNFEINFVDNIYASNETILNNLNDNDIIYLSKPNLYLTKVITFGTFDLFHIGHENILNNCMKYGNELIVGISNDNLNLKKGKISINNFEKRKNDVINKIKPKIIFEEESLEEKINYVVKYDANLLIMGDDWKDKFDFVPCMTKYLPRTPNISTTILKQNLKIN